MFEPPTKASLVKGRGTAIAVEGLRSLRYGDNPSALRAPPFHKGGFWQLFLHCMFDNINCRAGCPHPAVNNRKNTACANSQATASTVGAALAAARQERLNMDMKSSMKQFPCISLRAAARAAPTVYHIFLIIHVCSIAPSDCNEYSQPKPPL